MHADSYSRCVAIPRSPLRLRRDADLPETRTRDGRRGTVRFGFGGKLSKYVFCASSSVLCASVESSPKSI